MKVTEGIKMLSVNFQNFKMLSMKYELPTLTSQWVFCIWDNVLNCQVFIEPLSHSVNKLTLSTWYFQNDLNSNEKNGVTKDEDDSHELPNGYGESEVNVKQASGHVMFNHEDPFEEVEA